MEELDSIKDGMWAPDGSGFALSDGGGQFCVYSHGPAHRLRHAQPDQFYASDYNEIKW
jgi:hypothetical protein